MAENRNWIVYEHISPSRKVYVGITGRLPKDRFGIQGHKYLNRNSSGKYVHYVFALAILKYGWDNFEHNIVCTNLTREEACRKEEELIKRYKKEKRSYNITNGGEGTKGIHFKHSEETKKKISLHHAPMTQETIAKIKATMTGQKYSKERCVACSRGHDSEKIPVTQYTLDGKYIESYESIMAAERATGVRNSGITFCLSGRYKQSGGYIWKKLIK